MKDIYGKYIGTQIPWREAGIPADIYIPDHPWPDETAVSAGLGVVFRRDGNHYETLFMEVYPPGASFIRGEGATPAECEEACWKQYQRALNCPSGEHEWEARGYRNGAALCAHCNTFKASHFTGADLGQFCRYCGEGTTWHWDADGFTCEECRDADMNREVGR